MTEQATSTEVTAFLHSKFSKRLLPGATHDDMRDLHDQMVDHHMQAAKDLQKDYMGTAGRKDRGLIKKQMKWHANQANKHANKRDFFDHSNPHNQPIQNMHNYKSHNIPLNNPTTPARITKPAANQASPGGNGTGNSSTAPAQTNTFHAQPHAQTQNNAPSNPSNFVPRPSTGQQVMHHITKHAANLWHSFAPHVKHFFAKKHPTSPIVQSHLTGNPPMPVPPTQQAKAALQQAQFHTGQAAKLKTQALKVKNPTVRAKTMANANKHANLATGQNNLAQQAKAKATKKAPVVPSPLTKAPRAPKAPPAAQIAPKTAPLTPPAATAPPVAAPKKVPMSRATKIVTPSVTPKMQKTPVVPKAKTTKVTTINRSTKPALKTNKTGIKKQKILDPAKAV